MGFLGRGDGGVEACRRYFGLGLEIPCWLLVMGPEGNGKEYGGRGTVLWTRDDVGGDGGRGDKDGTGEMDSSGECVSDVVTETGELEGVPWRIDGCSGSSRKLYDREGVAGDKEKGKLCSLNTT
ncbi:hypothetical protein LIER_30838 [Lithospermum erythrorhizon]|uniref:Uncharacterized protein n=1 Tax=Lithospermum erythrorhizon TaxID=34254 RepID=A0AAV3RQ27_LITER